MMKSIILLTITISLALCGIITPDQSCRPSQLRLQLGDAYTYERDRQDQSNIQITFHTKSECSQVFVEINQNSQRYRFQQHEIVHSFYDGVQMCYKAICEIVYYDQYIHHFKIQLPKTDKFTYTINGGQFLSEQKTSIAHIPNNQKDQGVQNFIFFGDLDTSNYSQVTWNLLRTFDLEDLDAFIFLGDYGYEFFQKNGTYGDEFLETLEPFASRVPWIMTPGNHEKTFNYTFYNEKIHHINFKKSQNHYYSVDIGLLHFISLDLYFFNHDADESSQILMLEWLEGDLQIANQNRKNVPWVVAGGHVSVYCVAEECNDFAFDYAAFDDLFYKYGLDFFLGAHEHKFQFLKPLYKNTIYPYEQPEDHIIKNPQAPVYIIQGNGGNKNMDVGNGYQHDEYLLYNDNSAGIGKMTIFNSTDVGFQAMKSDGQQLIYYQHLKKESHEMPNQNLHV